MYTNTNKKLSKNTSEHTAAWDTEPGSLALCQLKETLLQTLKHAHALEF